MLKQLACASLLLALPLSARAESVWIGGMSFAESTGVGYLGVVMPFPGRRLSDGWSQSVFVDYVHYEYDLGSDRVVGRAKGIKYSIGREFELDSGFLGASAGVSLSRTDLSPDDPNNLSRGTRTRPVVEMQWRSKDQGDWSTRAYGQYVVGARRSLISGFVGKRLDNSMAIGPQVSTNGDPSYRVHGLALAVSGWKIGKVDVGANVGAEHSEGGKTGPAWGITLVMYRPD
ncbi:MAG TPA: cellulose biosynthesis protein BcsS [Arenimonas sp.]|nr:cellulose biosynthesis protein BcsS [Arenimonas sp.]